MFHEKKIRSENNAFSFEHVRLFKHVLTHRLHDDDTPADVISFSVSVHVCVWKNGNTEKKERKKLKGKTLFSTGKNLHPFITRSSVVLPK